jgi:hypothetical protein
VVVWLWFLTLDAVMGMTPKSKRSSRGGAILAGPSLPTRKINGPCRLIDVAPADGSRNDDAHNAYVFKRRVFQDSGHRPQL